MTAYMKPQERGVYQEKLAEVLADHSDARGRRAVPQADPRLKQLDAMQAGEQMDRRLMLGQMGMQKKGQEHDIKMGEGQLALQKGALGLGKKQFKFNLKQERKASTIAKYGMALNLAFGMAGFAQSLRNIRKQDFMFNLAQLQHQNAVMENQRLQEEQGNA